MRSHVQHLQEYPQLEIIRNQLTERQEDAVVEYRVYSFRQQRNGTTIRGDGFSVSDLTWIAGLALAWIYCDVGLKARAALLDHDLSVCSRSRSKLQPSLRT
jgi:hypothetical protein